MPFPGRGTSLPVGYGYPMTGVRQRQTLQYRSQQPVAVTRINMAIRTEITTVIILDKIPLLSEKLFKRTVPATACLFTHKKFSYSPRSAIFGNSFK